MMGVAETKNNKLYNRSHTIELSQGVAMGCGGAATPSFSQSAHSSNINSVRQRGIVHKTHRISIFRQIGLERSLFFGKSVLCTTPTIFFSFASGWNGLQSASILHLE